MINHHHPSIELIILSFLNTDGLHKKIEPNAVLNAHLQAATTFIETCISLNNLMKACKSYWMQLQKKIKNLNLWLSFKMRLNCNCIEDETLNITTKSQLSSVVSLAIKSQSHCRLQACRITARPGDRAMRII